MTNKILYQKKISFLSKKVFLAILIFFSFQDIVLGQKNSIRNIIVFDEEIINQSETQIDSSELSLNVSPEATLLRLQNGSIILKKIVLPNNKNYTNIKARLTISSSGCKWNRLVSCFLVPKSSNLRLEKIEIKSDSLPPLLGSSKNVHGITNYKKYKPCIEILRGIAPFGIGHYNEEMKERKPVYVPYWEKSVTWEQSASDLLSELQDSTYIGIKIDKPDEGGFKVSLELIYEESVISANKKQKTVVVPVINTVPYTREQSLPDIFSKEDVIAIANLKSDLKNVVLKYVVSGHGLHEGSDEFTPKKNEIEVNGSLVLRAIPWRDDCYTFRRYNPHSGIWTEKTEWKGQSIDERIASSDYPRSNWCPGSVVTPIEIPINNLQKGYNSIKFRIPEAQKTVDNKISYWLVSAYLVGEEQ